MPGFEILCWNPLIFQHRSNIVVVQDIQMAACHGFLGEQSQGGTQDKDDPKILIHFL